MVASARRGQDEPVEPAPVRGSATSIRDIGLLAGVSYQTVSRVLNGHPSVRPDTRRRVQAVIDQVQFRPSRTARELAVGGTRNVTVLTSNTSLHGPATTLAGIEQAARAVGVRVSVRVLESAAPEAVDAAVADVSDPRSGAVLVIAYDLAGIRALDAMPAGVRMAAAAEPLHGLRASAAFQQSLTWFDEVPAARAATRHLLDLGHRTVHFMSIPSSTGTGAREQGWLDALQSAGAPIPARWDTGSWEVRSAHQLGLDVLAPGGATAVLCGNDDLAIGLIRAARDLGLRVPQDISVVGFDDIPAAEFLSPALTTVRLDFAALGGRTFQLLGLDSRTDDAWDVPEPRLIIRESTAPPP